MEKEVIKRVQKTQERRENSPSTHTKRRKRTTARREEWKRGR
jgi:hypothetical protein